MRAPRPATRAESGNLVKRRHKLQLHDGPFADGENTPVMRLFWHFNTLLRCCPSFTPHIWGTALPPVTRKKSVRHSPVLFGGAILKVTKSSRIWQISSLARFTIRLHILLWSYKTQAMSQILDPNYRVYAQFRSVCITFNARLLILPVGSWGRDKVRSIFWGRLPTLVFDWNRLMPEFSKLLRN